MIESTKEEIKHLSFNDKYKILIDDCIDLENKTIYLVGNLNEEAGTLLRMKYEALKLYWKEEKKKKIQDITIDITSFGGSVYAIYGAIDFYDEMKKYDKVLVNTIAHGICMSAATVLLSGGTGTRMASKRCKLMLHDMQIGGMEGTAKQLEEMMKNIKSEKAELFNFYAKFSQDKNKPELSGKKLKEEARKWIERFADNSLENYISSKEALQLKLIDKII